MSSSNMTKNEIQSVELSILDAFSSFCKKNDLKFMLCGGTLLGAIRHKGFIPWDDDIDVCMPRPDYERLLDMTVRSNSESIEGRYIFAAPENGFVRPFCKLIDSNTEVQEQFTGSSDGMNGLWIDILPLDGLPSDYDELVSIYRKRAFLGRCNALCYARIGGGKSLFKRVLKPLPKAICRAIGPEYFTRRIEQLCFRHPYETSEYVGVLSNGLYGAGERMRKTGVEKTVLVDFEGSRYPAMSCWDEYLSGIYGDYMQLPPAEKRETHLMSARFLGAEQPK